MLRIGMPDDIGDCFFEDEIDILAYFRINKFFTVKSIESKCVCNVFSLKILFSKIAHTIDQVFIFILSRINSPHGIPHAFHRFTAHITEFEQWFPFSFVHFVGHDLGLHRKAG